MTENYDHYISRSIKSVYLKKLIAPFLSFLLLIILWFLLPFSELLFPNRLSDYTQIENSARKGKPYIQIDLTDLYFTGYTNTLLGQTTGYYYYTLQEGRCIFVLLSGRTSEEGLPHIEHARIRGKILNRGRGYQQLAEALAQDLDWTERGLKGKTSSYLISEPAFLSPLSIFLLFLYFSMTIYALAEIGTSILYIFFPVLSPPCRRLGRFGKASLLLAEAEEELATLPQLATEDMFITEHYFIEIADSGIAVVPIQEMVWIYKYSTLHKIFWYHFNISYTLHITTSKHLHIQCPKNIKSDIDGIIDYLAEANHNILVGFSEENRRKVLEAQDPKINLEKLLTLRKKKK